MAHSTNIDDNKHDTTSPDTYDQSTYDADEFLYSAVPFGEYPEVTTEAINSKTSKTSE